MGDTAQRPSALQSPAPVTEAFPPGTEEQGQKSHQKSGPACFP